MQSVSRFALGVAEFLTPVLKESKFKETGVITPEEFVASGDFLVYHCPTWQWCSGDPAKSKSFLPADKQYLLTRNVPCYKRVSQLICNQNQVDVVIDGDDPDGGWVDTFHNDETATSLTEKAGEMTLNDKSSRAGPANVVGQAANAGDDDDEDDDDDEEEAMDMAAFMKGECQIDEDDLLEAPAGVKSTRDKSSELEGTSPGAASGAVGATNDILQTRTYDLHITYDKYYQTSRMWLCGYNEAGKQLSEQHMFADFSQDHAKKTVTMETHPHLPGGITMASIHPCRQAEVMKKLIAAVAEGGTELGVHQYILIFLKFVQAVIPTIEYDYTRNFNM